MKKALKKSTFFIFISAFIFSIVPTMFSADTTPEEYKTAYKKTGDYIASLGTPTVGSVGGEWAVLGLARADFTLPENYYSDYYENVLEYVEQNINENEQLHRVKSTDNSRVILALTAAGFDVTDVRGHNLLKGLSDLDYVKKQGINGPIWTLLAVDSLGYEIPEADEGKTQTTREALIDTILSYQLEDGGWSLFGKNADPDMTAMALQSLAPYYENNDEVKTAVSKAVERLSEIQLSDGGYGSIGGACSESSAQVITALTSLKINPHTDSRFIKNGKSVLDALCSFFVEDGGFKHTADGKVNGMATEQGYYALAAYFRFEEGKTSLYDMSDLKSNEDDDSDNGENPNEAENPPEKPEEAQTPSKEPENTEKPNKKPPVSDDEPSSEGQQKEENKPNKTPGDISDSGNLPNTDNKPQTTPDNTSDNSINMYIVFMTLSLSAAFVTILKRRKI